MQHILILTGIFALLLSCKGNIDNRTFGALSIAGKPASDDAVADPDDVVIDKDVDGGAIDDMGKGEDPKPELPKEIKDKLTKCWPQWETTAGADKYEIRQVNLNVDRLNRSRIDVPGEVAEVVFIDITSATSIRNVQLALGNAKGLYCLDISAVRTISNLDITYVCGAKIGLIDVSASRTRRVNVREVCNKP